MMFNRFRWNVVIRLVTILVVMGITVYYTLVTRHYLRAVYLGIVFTALAVELFFYVDRRNRDLIRFFEALGNGDGTVRFREGRMGKSFQQLYRIMNGISEKFQILRTDREIQFQYLQALLEHVKIGIISFDETGMIHMVNQSFRDYFKNPRLRKGRNITLLDTDLVELLQAIQTEERRVYDWSDGHASRTSYIIQSTAFKLEDQEFKLVSAQNIRQELDDQEILAWQKLIRILTHEIMNSVTPVASLSASLHDMVKKGIQPDNMNNIQKKLENGLGAIRERSQGLMQFTEAYKALTRIPPPNLETLQSTKLRDRIEILFSSLLSEKKIRFEVQHPDDPWEFQGDMVLIEMVVLNLMQNAIEALESTKGPEIMVRVSQTKGISMHIDFQDNGMGMDKEVLDQIFVPFYSTKPKGSGIGLSISNQIIRSMGGYISVRSTPGKGSVFRVVL